MRGLSHRVTAALILALLWAVPASAGSLTLLGAGGPSAAVAYSGPGDVVASARAWWGLRAYSAADKGNKLIQVCNASDVACVDWSSDATSGALVAQAVGATDCTAVNTCTIKTWYDRSGALACTGSVACDATQATIASRATLTFSCINSKPCAVFAGAAQYATPNLTTSISQPYSVSAVANRNGAFTSNGMIFTIGTGNFALNFRATASAIQMGAGVAAQFISNITDSNFHAVEASYNGASSVLWCVGSAGSSCSTGGTSNSISPGTQVTGNALPLQIGHQNGAIFLTAQLSEVGLWALDFTASSRQNNMGTNQYNYWGAF